jgi:hypothetical protein
MNRFAILLLLITLSTEWTFAQRVPIKNVAVIETQVDEHSGAADEINMAELREITAVLRREAVKALPKNRFNIMTAETVLAMGEAVLEECAEENCVIALGSKIGADYIVRGIISKFQTRFSLTVELYETDYGNLISVADAVRSANLEDVLEKSSAACAVMYADFMKKTGMSAMAQEIKTVAVPETVVVMVDGKKRHFSLDAKYMIPGPRLTPKYGGLMLEFAWARENRSYWGFDVGFGISGTERNDFYVALGATVNRGWAYDIMGETRLEYGLSLGLWYMRFLDYQYTDSNFNYVITNEDIYRLGFGGPSIKLRWRYLEISYRMLIGTGFDYEYNYYPYSETYSGYGIHYNTQLTAGVRFGGKKRVK